MLSSARARFVVVLVLAACCIAGCARKLECGPNDTRLAPGESVSIATKTYTAGTEPCCVAIRDGEIVSDCKVE